MQSRSSRAPSTPEAMELVRTFYRDVLGGREVCSGRCADRAESLWFRIDSTLLEARTTDGDERPPIVLECDAPEEVAERCWDAGFAVQVRDDATGRASLSVLDPFGRRIDLTARRTTGRRRAHVTRGAAW